MEMKPLKSLLEKGKIDFTQLAERLATHPEFAALLNKLIVGYFESKSLGKEMLEKQMRIVVERMNLATRDDLQELSKKVEALDNKIKSLELKPAKSAAVKTTKSGCSKKAPPKRAPKK